MTVAVAIPYLHRRGFGASPSGIGPGQVVDVAGGQSLSIDNSSASHLGGKAGAFWCVRQGFASSNDPPLGVKVAWAIAYDLLGPAIEALSMEERMTLLQMAMRVAARWRALRQSDATDLAYLQRQADGSSGELGGRCLVASLARPEALDDRGAFRCLGPGAHGTWGITPAGDRSDEAVPPPSSSNPTSAPLASSFTSYIGPTRGLRWPGLPVDVLHRQLHQRFGQ